MDNSMQEKWDFLHSQKGSRLKYPNEQVVQFVFRNFRRDGQTRVLDLGCGSGRHVMFMAQENICAYGTDISAEAIENSLERLGQDKLSAVLKVSPANEIPFEDDFFDGIICFAVLYYCKKEQIKEAFEEIKRVMKPGAKGLIVVRNTSDYRFSCGQEVEKNTFIIKEEDPTKASYNENGMVMHFFEREELAQLLKDFSSYMIDTLVESHYNGKYSDSNFLIEFVK